MNRPADPLRPAEAASVEEARTRRALLHMLEDLQRERNLVAEARHQWINTVDSIRDPIMVHGADGRILRANKAYAKRAGSGYPDIIGRHYWECFPKRETPMSVCAAAGKAGSGPREAPSGEEFTLGTGETFVSRVFPIPDPSGGHAQELHIFEDITERKLTEQTLAESEEKHRLLFVSSRDAFMTLAPPDWRFTSANPSALAMFRVKDEAEFVLKSPWELSPERQPDGRVSTEKANEMIETAMREGNHFFDWTHRRIDGDAFPATVLLTRLTLKGRTLLNACVRDVTNLRQAQDAVVRSERYYRKLIEGSSDAFFVMDRDGNVTYRSESGKRLTGFETADVMGKALMTYVRPESLSEARHAIAEVVQHPETQSRAELRIGRKDGSEVEVEAIGRNLLGDPDVGGIIVTARDITERKRAEQTLLRVNRALKTLSKCNEALVHASSEKDLLGEMCRIAVEIGGYRLAWVGFAEYGADKSVRAVAHSGLDEGHLAGAAITWADTAHGRGPTGLAIQEAKTQIVSDTATDPRFAPWRTDAIRREYGSTIALPLRSEEGTFGTFNIYARERNAFDEEEVSLLEELANDLAFGIVTLRMHAVHRASADRLQRSMESTVQTIGATVEMRDPYTAGHQNRVAQLAAAIAREMGLPEDQIHGLHLASVVHDLGKIQIPAEILIKPTQLTPVEYEIIKTHAQSGYEILKDVDFPWPIAEIVRQHHERLDGSGYPRGLKANDILIEAKILAVADTVEAMGAARPYRPAVGIDAALKEVLRGRGTQYDTAAVDACLRLFSEKRFHFKELPAGVRI